MEKETDFAEFLENFSKRPIFPDQEAQIVWAMIDGKINKNTAKELYQNIMEQNLKAHDKIMNMSMEEILELAKKYKISLDAE